MPRPSKVSSTRRRREKPKGRLFDLAQIQKVDYVLLSDIRKHLLKQIDAPSDRRQDVLHPSEMAKADWCPRQSWFRLSGAPESDPQKKHGYQLENIFDEGHTIHAKWQNRLWDMGILEGKWLCNVCGHTWWGKAPEKCPQALCGAGRKLLEYREVPVDGYERYLIHGHEDGLVGTRLIEIKSIGMGTLRMDAPALLREYSVDGPKGRKIYDLDGIWRDLKTPLPSHVRQTMIYAMVLIESGIEITEVVFLYEFKSNQDVKEFTIKVRPRVGQPLLDQALDIKFALEKGLSVPRNDDLTRESKACKECPFQTTCWEEESNDKSSTRRKTDEASEADGSVVGRKRRVIRAETSAGRGDRSSGAPRRQRPISAGGSDGSRRRRTNVPVPATDGVERISGSPAGGQRSRRVIRGG